MDPLKIFGIVCIVLIAAGILLPLCSKKDEHVRPPTGTTQQTELPPLEQNTFFLRGQKVQTAVEQAPAPADDGGNQLEQVSEEEKELFDNPAL